jgi:hypothetical protein
MRSHALLLAILVAGCLTTSAPTLAPAAPPPTTLTCGQVVTQDVVLAADVVCESPFQEGTPGLVVGADGITIDLNGHRVETYLSVAKVAGPGIVNEGYDGVAIRNGTATGGEGISLTNARENRLVGVSAASFFPPMGSLVGGTAIQISGGSGNTVESSTAGRIVAAGSPGVRIAGSTVSAVVIGPGSDNSMVESSTANDGVFVENSLRARIADSTVSPVVIGAGSDRSVVTGNNALGSSIAVVASRTKVVGNGAATVGVLAGTGNVVDSNVVVSSPADGIRVFPAATNTGVLRNIVAKAADDGIEVDAASTLLVRNVAVNNADYGIEAVPGVSASGNRASGNGNPAQCLNVVCQPAT